VTTSRIVAEFLRTYTLALDVFKVRFADIGHEEQTNVYAEYTNYNQVKPIVHNGPASPYRRPDSTIELNML